MTDRPIIRNFPFGLENGKTICLSRRLPTLGGVFPSQCFRRSGDPHLDDPCYNVTGNRRDTPHFDSPVET
jgi:hypothetical protein